MRTLVWTILSILLLSGVGGNSLPYRLPSRTRQTQRPQGGCRCVPDQWEGVMTTTEHEFDLHDGHHVETGSHVRIYYDYSSRKFATRDLITGRRSVANYATGISFSVDGSRCLSIPIKQRMRRMCFPDFVEKLGSTQIGGQLPVTIWQFTDAGNVTIRTVVTTNSCIPISEDILVKEKDYVSVTSTLYSDMTLRVDPEAFWTPSDCLQLAGYDFTEHETSPLDLQQRRRHVTAANRSAD